MKMQYLLTKLYPIWDVYKVLSLEDFLMLWLILLGIMGKCRVWILSSSGLYFLAFMKKTLHFMSTCRTNWWFLNCGSSPNLNFNKAAPAVPQNALIFLSGKSKSRSLHFGSWFKMMPFRSDDLKSRYLLSLWGGGIRFSRYWLGIGCTRNFCRWKFLPWLFCLLSPTTVHSVRCNTALGVSRTWVNSG